QCPIALLDLHSFPTRRSSDLREPLRYVAIRIRQKQGELFADGSAVKYFAVATNLWDWTPKKLLGWHREKAGSIEAAHDVLKNELDRKSTRLNSSHVAISYAVF